MRSGERICLGLDLRLTLEEPQGRGHQRAGLRRVLGGLQEGLGVVMALRRSGLALPPEAWCLLEAGEQTGGLGEAWLAVGTLLRDQERHRRELHGQLWYPALVSLVGAGVMCVLLVWFIPQLRQVAADMGGQASMPWITEHIGLLYGAVLGFLSGAILLTLSALVLLRQFGRTRPACSAFLESVLSALPLAGRIRREVREARLFRQMGTLLRGGIPLPAAVLTTSSASSSAWEREQLAIFRQRLLMGAPVAECIHGCRLFSQASRSLLVAGQESGQLDVYLLRLAEEDETLAAWRLQQAVRLLEPALLLGLSIAVGGLILAYLLPMVRLLEQLA